MAPYLQILFGLIFMLSLWTVFKSLVYNMHMFQLNEYRFSEHIPWMKKNIRHYFSELTVLALSLTGLLENDVLMGFSAAALCIAVFSLLISNRNRPAKKPLVYTPRVKRMIVTLCLIYILITAGMFCLLASARKNLAFLVLGLTNALNPLFILLANTVNKPMEKGINARYTREAKKMLAQNKELETIGITGSYGKTSVKFYLYALLRTWTDTLVTPASFNTPMGIVKTVRGSLTSLHKIFLCEMGAKWVGDIDELCRIVHPKHGIITALGDQHLESFGSRENIIKTKYELSDALPAEGRLYVNWDNEIIRQHPPKHNHIRYGTSDDCDYKAYDITEGIHGTAFTVRTPDGETERFETKLLGHHSVVNITGAIAAANGFGMPLKDMKLPVIRLEAVKHRMELIEKNGITVIDDAFNSNPAGCSAALETLSKMDGVKILVTPGMVELGKKEDEENRLFGQKAAACCDYIVLVGSKQTKAIYEGAVKAGFAPARLHVEEQFTDAMKFVYAIKSEKKKIVLLENDLPDNY